MARLGEHIEHHGKKITHHIRHHAKHSPQAFWMIVGAIFALAILCLIFFHERSTVRQQDISSPIPCEKLIFSTNGELCERILNYTYSALPPLDRAPICNQTNRNIFGIAQQQCSAYDDELSFVKHNPALQERGISIWAPSDEIHSNGTLRIKTLSAITAVHLVCNNMIVPSMLQGDLIVIRNKINGTCELIATNPEGSMTSLPFKLTMR